MTIFSDVGSVLQKVVSPVNKVLNNDQPSSIDDIKNSNYKVLLVVHESGVGDDKSNTKTVNSYKIEFYVPHKIKLKFGSKWDMPFSGGNTPDLLAATGININNPWSTAKVWKGYADLSQSIEFKLVAETEGAVKKQLERLVRISLPRRMGPVLVAPGPSIVGQLGNAIATALGQDSVARGTVISMLYGNSLYFDSIVIDSVDLDIESKWSRTGDIIVANGSLTFRPFINPDADKVAQILRMQSQVYKP